MLRLLLALLLAFSFAGEVCAVAPSDYMLYIARGFDPCEKLMSDLRTEFDYFK